MYANIHIYFLYARPRLNSVRRSVLLQCVAVFCCNLLRVAKFQISTTRQSGGVS